jgi:hypothetical protein
VFDELSERTRWKSCTAFIALAHRDSSAQPDRMRVRAFLAIALLLTAASCDSSRTHSDLASHETAPVASAGLSQKEPALAEPMGPLLHAPPAAPLTELPKRWGVPTEWHQAEREAKRACKANPDLNVVTCASCGGHRALVLGDGHSSRRMFYDEPTGKLIGVCECGDVVLPGGPCMEFGVHPHLDGGACVRTIHCAAKPSLLPACTD